MTGSSSAKCVTTSTIILPPSPPGGCSGITLLSMAMNADGLASACRGQVVVKAVWTATTCGLGRQQQRVFQYQGMPARAGRPAGTGRAARLEAGDVATLGRWHTDLYRFANGVLRRTIAQWQATHHTASSKHTLAHPTVRSNLRVEESVLEVGKAKKRK